MPRPVFRNSGKPITEADIAAAEAQLGVTFPEQYRRFLLQTNGGQPNPYAVDDLPIDILCRIGDDSTDDLVYYANMKWELGVPRDLLAIGCDMCGLTICLGIRGSKFGKLYIYDQEFDELTFFKDDFDTFLDGFYEPDFSDLDDGDSDDDGDESDYDNKAER